MSFLMRIIDGGVDRLGDAVYNKHVRFTNAVAMVLCVFVIVNISIAVFHDEPELTAIYSLHLVCMAMTLVWNHLNKRSLASIWLSLVMICFVTAYSILYPFDTFTIVFLSPVIFLLCFIYPAQDRKYLYLSVALALIASTGALLWHMSGMPPLWTISKGASDAQRWLVVTGMPGLCTAFGLYAFFSIHKADRETAVEKEKADRLLLNILPAQVTRELTETGSVKPARFEDVTILFSDFKDFTNIVATIPTPKLIEELNDIFSHFDEIMEDEGVEKIQTIGDAYLAAGGLPVSSSDHALKCMRAAKRMISYIDQRNETKALKWKIRIGLHSGPIAAGVIGKKKFAYSLFGDTINTANRIETAGEEGRINVSAYTYDLIRHHYPGEYRGKIIAKGKGDMDMYFV